MGAPPPAMPPPPTIRSREELGRRRGPSGWVLAMIVALVVLVAGGAGAAVVVLGRHGGSGSSPVVRRSSSVGARQASGASTPSTSTSTSTSTTVVSVAAQQAGVLSQLLGASGTQRSELITAVTELTNCQDVTQATSTIESVYQGRQSLVDQLNGLNLSALPDAPTLVQTLTAAWDDSATSDQCYAALGNDLEGETCTAAAVSSDPNLAAATAADASSTDAKQQFVAAWNPIAASYGLPQQTAQSF